MECASGDEIREAHCGSSPSRRDMEKNTRDCPSIMTSMTVPSPNTAPTSTSNSPHELPVAAMPKATGAATFNSL